MFRKTKYGAKRLKHAGFSFASKLEAAVYDLLVLREKAGEIKDIQHQDHILLTEARIVSIPDFKYFDLKTNDYCWGEAKGFETDIWRLKKRLWAVYGPGPLEIYRGTATNIRLTETIFPKRTK